MDNNVTFEYKDYADNGSKKKMTLTGAEFLRRYEQHDLSRQAGYFLPAFAKSGTMVIWAITNESSG